MLTSHPDDNGWAVQVVAKLNETIAEITSLSTQLQVEREKVKSLMEEKAHMLDTMEGIYSVFRPSRQFTPSPSPLSLFFPLFFLSFFLASFLARISFIDYPRYDS